MSAWASDRDKGRAVEFDATFEGDTLAIRSDRVVAAAGRLWTLRKALRASGRPSLPMRVRLSLGRLPTITLGPSSKT